MSEFDSGSYTPLAIQRDWRTPNAFPSCPDQISDQPLKDYLHQLCKGSIFSHNKYGESLVVMAVLSDDGTFISVVTSFTNNFKGWGLVKITFEGGKFVHSAYGTFFTREGAEKSHCELIGKMWNGEGSIDDYC